MNLFINIILLTFCIKCNIINVILQETDLLGDTELTTSKPIDTTTKSIINPDDFLNNNVAKQVPNIAVNDNQSIPAIGFGTLGIAYHKQAKLLRRFNNDQKASATIIEALKSGYRHIDAAYFYNVEPAINVALGQLITKNLTKRSGLFISTKIWSTFHRRDRIIKGLNTSLNEMGLKYVDLAVLHYPTGFQDGADIWPVFQNGSIMPRTWLKHDYLEAWLGMEKAHRLGLTRMIGVANFNIDQLKILISRTQIKPVVNQVECNPTYQQNEMLEFCNQNNIKMVAYSPLKNGDYQVCDNPVLKTIGTKYNKSAAQVALRWNFQRGVVNLVKATKKNHQDENLSIFNYELDAEDMQKIAAIPALPRTLQIPALTGHPDYPFKDDPPTNVTK